MITINRRRFASVAAISAAGLALGAKEVVAQYVDLEGEKSFISLFTGAEVAVGRSGMKLTSRFDSDDGTEIVMMSNQTSVTAIKFVPSGDAEEFLQKEYDVTANHYEDAEEVDFQILDDGGWFAMGIVTTTGRQRGNYVEYQSGAFPDHDLLIDFTADIDTFSDDFEAVQKATIADLAPFLFEEESEVLAMTFPALTLESTTTGTRGNSRSTRGGSNNSTETGGSRSTRGSSTTTSSGTYVEDVTRHREDFLDTFDEFNLAMATFANDDRTEAEIDEAFSTFSRLSNQWVEYPEQAEELVAPAEYADLESAYLQWASDIGMMGSLWLDVLQRKAEVADFFDQIDIVIESDEDLEAALDAV